MKTADRLFGCLQILGACGHTLGTIVLTPFMSSIFVWSLGASIGMFLTGALNLLRAGRPDDRTVALLALAGSGAQLVLCLAFGKSIGNLADPRVVGNCVITAILLCFGTRTLVMIGREKGTSNPEGYQPELLSRS